MGSQRQALRYLVGRISIVGVLALSIAACSSGSDSSGSGLSGSGLSGSGLSGSEDASASAASQSGNTTVDSCVVGTWRISAEELGGYYSEISKQSGSESLEFEVDGTSDVEFTADGTIIHSPDFSMDIEIAGIGATGTVFGTSTGIYEIDGNALIAELDDDDISVDVEMGGISLNQSDIGGDFSLDLPFSDVTFSCADNSLTVAFSTGTGSHDVQLVPV